MDPRSYYSFRWDTFISVLLIITVFTMPLSMAYAEVCEGNTHDPL